MDWLSSVFVEYADEPSYSVVEVNPRKPLERQLNQAKTVYVISSVFDLNGQQLHLPDSCYLKFKRKGAIRNAVITGRLLNDSIDPVFLGAYGDGKRDDTQALQNAFNVQVSNIRLEGRKYYVKGYLIVRSATSIQGEGASLLFSPKERAFPGLVVQGVSDVTIRGVCFISKNEKRSGSPFSRTEGTLWSNRYSIMASKVKSFTIENCSFQDVECAIKIDGGVGNNENIIIRACSTSGAVGTPVYISHTDFALIDSCSFDASMDVSRYDHHLYGCESNHHHIVSNCSFSNGVGIPVHYYSDESIGSDDIQVNNCLFENTCGAILVSSKGNGTLSVKDVVVNTLRKYDNGVFRSGGNQTLIVTRANVFAPEQRLFSCESVKTEIRYVVASVGGLVYGLPPSQGNFVVEDSNITISSAPYLLYLSEKVAPKTGDIVLRGNSFLIFSDIEYLISVRGTTLGTVSLDNNEIQCIKNAKYAVYNAGMQSQRLVVRNNRMKGISRVLHSSVSGGSFDNNTLEK